MRFDHCDGDPDKESQFYILKHTVCPAVLSENFFFDNEKDCRFMMSDDGKERIAKVHFEAIKKLYEKVFDLGGNCDGSCRRCNNMGATNEN